MKNKKTILVTGGAGFIGSALIRHIIRNTKHSVVNIDKLAYSGNLQSLESIKEKVNGTEMVSLTLNQNKLQTFDFKIDRI